MSVLNVKDKGSCKHDCISLGEVMFRFDPVMSELNARSLRCGIRWRIQCILGLRKCFDKHRCGNCTCRQRHWQACGRPDDARWCGCFLGCMGTHDGTGRMVAMDPLTEKALYPWALGVSDRGNTAATQHKNGYIYWE